MKNIIVFFILLTLTVSCRNRPETKQQSESVSHDYQSDNGSLIGKNIVTEVIVRPPAGGDPWEQEKVEGYQGDSMINTIYDRIYDKTLTAYNYHTGEPLSVNEVKEFENRYDGDRSKIGKLSFTEDWYYNAGTNTIKKVIRSVVFGYESVGDEGRIGYIAAFRVDLQ